MLREQRRSNELYLIGKKAYCRTRAEELAYPLLTLLAVLLLIDEVLDVEVLLPYIAAWFGSYSLKPVRPSIIGLCILLGKLGGFGEGDGGDREVR